MSEYRRGDYGEKKVCDALRIYDYAVWQTRQSRGVVDIIAMHPYGEPLFVQVKIGGRVAHYEWNKLFRLATRLGAIPLIAQARPNNPIEWLLITGLHEQRSKQWPSERAEVIGIRDRAHGGLSKR